MKEPGQSISIRFDGITLPRYSSRVPQPAPQYVPLAPESQALPSPNPKINIYLSESEATAAPGPVDCVCPRGCPRVFHGRQPVVNPSVLIHGRQPVGKAVGQTGGQTGGREQRPAPAALQIQDFLAGAQPSLEGVETACRRLTEENVGVRNGKFLDKCGIVLDKWWDVWYLLLESCFI